MLKETEFVRMIDNLGRIVVPKTIRDEMGIKEEQHFQYFIDKENDTILLKKYNIKVEE